MTTDPTTAVDESTDELKPADIDERFAPRLRENIASVEIDGESVLLVEGTYRLHWLNQLATIVVSCFDGAATLDELVADFRAAFRADPEVIRNDLLGITRQLGAAGLLAGVAEEIHDHQGPTYEGLEEGTEIPSFSFPDLDGRPVSLEDYRGRKVLLVNWSPSCGFCKRIAPELAELQPDLRKNDVELVMLTIGDPHENKLVFEETDLDVTVLVQDQPVEFFASLGTPVAYLLDEEGRVASDLTVGAMDVPVLARAAAGREPEGE
ncbi:MAG: PqqD family peptide modification chaperone [Actinomycetota bacterium]